MGVGVRVGGGRVQAGAGEPKVPLVAFNSIWPCIPCMKQSQLPEKCYPVLE